MPIAGGPVSVRSCPLSHLSDDQPVITIDVLPEIVSKLRGSGVAAIEAPERFEDPHSLELSEFLVECFVVAIIPQVLLQKEQCHYQLLFRSKLTIRIPMFS